MPQTLADRVVTLRKQVGLSQEKLAQHLDMSRNTLLYIETGRTRHPRSDHIVALCRYFGVSADELLGLLEPQESAHG